MPRTDNHKQSAAEKKRERLASRYTLKNTGKKATGNPGVLAKLKAMPTFLPTVFQLARRGAQYVEIAQAFRVSEASVKTWSREDDEFLAAYKKGKDEWDSGEVESALLKSARGFDYTETSVKTIQLRTKQKDADGKPKTIATPAEEVTVANKKMAPNVGAIVFWLTNRQRERWQNTRYVQHAGKVDGPPAVQNVYQLSPEDLKDLPQEDLENFAHALRRAADQKRDAGTGKPDGPSGTA